MGPEFAKVTFLGKDRTRTPANLDELVKHLQKLGLRSPGSYDGRTGQVFLHEKSVKWAKFEIIENNDTVVMEVNRKDNTITRCYLSRGFVNPNEIHLQVTSGLRPDEPHPVKAIEGAEVHGIFPLEIRAINAGFSSNDGEYIGFYGSDRKSGIEITWDGRIRFSWA